MDVGFIGLGIMGASMASNLQTAGHALRVHDIRRQAAARRSVTEKDPRHDQRVRRLDLQAERGLDDFLTLRHHGTDGAGGIHGARHVAVEHDLEVRSGRARLRGSDAPRRTAAMICGSTVAALGEMIWV